MSKTVRIVAIIGVILFVVAALTHRSQRSRNAAALTAYKAELRARGEKLTGAELGFPRPPEASSNLDLLGAGVNRIAAVPFDPSLVELMHFVSADRAEVAWSQPQLRTIATQGGNTNPVPWEVFSSQFETAADALRDIRDATQVPPRYFFNDPFAFSNFTNRPKALFVELRKAAQWLAGDAIAALHASQPDRARADIHALTQLAQFHREDITLVSQMVRTAIAGMGLATTWEALQAPGWSEENLATLQKDWEAVDLANVFETGMLGQRANGEAAFAYLRSPGRRQRAAAIHFGNPPNRRSPEDYFAELVGMPLWAANSEADELLFLQHHQKLLETMRLARTGTPMVQIYRQLTAIDSELVAIARRPLARYRYLMCAIAIPNFVRAGSTCIRNETQRRLTITAIALERYRLHHGKSPPELATLVPQFLSAVTIDLMSAKPLRYRLNADGSFTLYSVGEDGCDDGGDPNSASGTNKFGLWEGRDAVWPAAAK